MNHHVRDWSSLPESFLSLTSDLLNAIDHVRFRSVVSQWRKHTEQRQKAPLVILIDQYSEDQVLHGSLMIMKDLSLFDIIQKEIITIPFRHLLPSSSSPAANFYYLGSSRGWIFIGVLHGNEPYQEQQLRITLFNPFTSTKDGIINLPTFLEANIHPLGRVFLLGETPSLHLDSFSFTVVYYYPKEDSDSGQVCIFKSVENHWTSFLIKNCPHDVVVCHGRLYANYKGTLLEIDLETQKLCDDASFLLPGLPEPNSKLLITSKSKDHHRVTSKSKNHHRDPSLRFFEDYYGQLHLLFTSSYRTRSFIFMKVNVMPRGNVKLSAYGQPYFLKADNCLWLSINLLQVESLSIPWLKFDVVYLNPVELLAKLSEFLASMQYQHRWKPVGWITPTLL